MMATNVNAARITLALMRATFWFIVLVFPASLIYLFVFVLHSGEQIEARFAESAPKSQACHSSIRYAKAAGKGIPEQSPEGFSYWLKTPLNYSHEQSWPLLIMFSPVMSGRFMEAYTGLTASITQAGFVVAYVDSVAMNMKQVPRLEWLARDIASKWCIDEKAIFLSGHSDGATISQALHFLPEINTRFAGFISSAAGVDEQALKGYPCPYPSNAFVLHNTGDKHFEDFGLGAAQWWATCNACESRIETSDACIVFDNCQDGVTVRFCEQTGGHLTWPDREREILEFLIQSKKRD